MVRVCFELEHQVGHYFSIKIKIVADIDNYPNDVQTVLNNETNCIPNPDLCPKRTSSLLLFYGILNLNLASCGNLKLGCSQSGPCLCIGSAIYGMIFVIFKEGSEMCLSLGQSDEC